MKRRFEELSVGQTAQRTVKFTAEAVEAFARLTGDCNPVHLDDAYAAGTLFKKRIVHGMLVAGLFSAIIGMDLPGEGSVYLGQELKFVKPVYIGDQVTATVCIVEIMQEKKRILLETVAVNQNGEEVLTGRATVKFLG